MLGRHYDARGPSRPRGSYAQSVAFGPVPPTAIVLHEHRCLSAFHMIAIVKRGRPMVQTICRVLGGHWLRSVEELQVELAEREEAQAARLAALQEEYDAGGLLASSTGGMTAAWIRF